MAQELLPALALVPRNDHILCLGGLGQRDGLVPHGHLTVTLVEQDDRHMALRLLLEPIGVDFEHHGSVPHQKRIGNPTLTRLTAKDLFEKVFDDQLSFDLYLW